MEVFDVFNQSQRTCVAGADRHQEVQLAFVLGNSLPIEISWQLVQRFIIQHSKILVLFTKGTVSHSRLEGRLKRVSEYHFLSIHCFHVCTPRPDA